MSDASPTRPIRRGTLAVAAAVAATVVGAGVLALPANAAAPGGEKKAPPKLEITDGTLEWGVKESFRKYLTGPIGQGRITVADGATQAEGNGPFTFSGGKGSYDTATHAVDTTFKGSVRFTGHGGALDLEFSDLKVHTEGTKGSISLDVTTPERTDDDVPFATLDLTGLRPGAGEGGAVTFARIPATLTAEGAKAFNGMYQAGQALDPATVTVKAGAPTAAPSPTPTGGQSSTPGPTPTVGPTPSTSNPPTGGPSPSPSTPPPTGRPTGTPSGGAATPPTRPAGTIADGTLDWGVKESFRSYVTGPVAKGRITVSAGARKQTDGFRFPAGHGTYDAHGTRSLNAAFDGAVRFTGHEGKLDLKLSDLKVRIKGAKGSLLADVSAKDRATGKVNRSGDLAVAKLTMPAGALTATGDTVSLTDVRAELTHAGAGAFGGFYQPGDALDPVTVAVSLKDGAALPGTAGGQGGTGSAGDGEGSGSDTSASGGGVVGGGSGTTASLAATGSALPAGALLGGAGLLGLGGAAAVFATRRRAGGDPAR